MPDRRNRGRPFHLRPQPYLKRDIQVVVNLTVISGSVGNLNAGGIQTIESIDVTLSNLVQNPQSKDVGEAFKKLTEAVAGNNDIPAELKNDTLEQLKFLADHAPDPSKSKISVVKSVIDTVSSVFSNADKLTAIWQECGPTILSWFGL